MDITRSQFLRLITGAGAGALGLGAVAACGDDKNTKTPDASKPIDAPKPPIDAPMQLDAAIDAPVVPGNCLQNGTNVAIGTNHGHTMAVSKADVMAGVDKTYDIKGASAHFHNVTVTAAMFAMLQQNTTVMTVSDVGDSAHTHAITVVCA